MTFHLTLLLVLWPLCPDTSSVKNFLLFHSAYPPGLGIGPVAPVPGLIILPDQVFSLTLITLIKLVDYIKPW